MVAVIVGGEMTVAAPAGAAAPANAAVAVSSTAGSMIRRIAMGSLLGQTRPAKAAGTAPEIPSPAPLAAQGQSIAGICSSS